MINYHPTDDVNSHSQGGKGFESDGSKVDFGLDEEPAKVQYEDPKNVTLKSIFFYLITYLRILLF